MSESKKLTKIVIVDEENLHIFRTTFLSLSLSLSLSFSLSHSRKGQIDPPPDFLGLMRGEIGCPRLLKFLENP